MISGLYYTSLVKLAAPAKLQISQEADGMLFYMRYNRYAYNFKVSITDMLHAKTDKQLVTLIENKIIEVKNRLIIPCNECI